MILDNIKTKWYGYKAPLSLTSVLVLYNFDYHYNIKKISINKTLGYNVLLFLIRSCA